MKYGDDGVWLEEKDETILKLPGITFQTNPTLSHESKLQVQVTGLRIRHRCVGKNCIIKIRGIVRYEGLITNYDSLNN